MGCNLKTEEKMIKHTAETNTEAIKKYKKMKKKTDCKNKTEDNNDNHEIDNNTRDTTFTTNNKKL